MESQEFPKGHPGGSARTASISSRMPPSVHISWVRKRLEISIKVFPSLKEEEEESGHQLQVTAASSLPTFVTLNPIELSVNMEWSISVYPSQEQQMPPPCPAASHSAPIPAPAQKGCTQCSRQAALCCTLCLPHSLLSHQVFPNWNWHIHWAD